MRIEFQLTADDFIDGQIAHAVNSPRPRARPGAFGILIYVVTWVGYVGCAYWYLPWFNPHQPIDALMACVLVPMIPWMLVIGRTGFILCRKRSFKTPWKAGARVATRAGSLWKPWVPILPSLIGLSCAVTIIAIKAPSIRHPDSAPNVDPMMPFVAILPLPLWIFSFSVVVITRLSRRANAWRAWEQQTHMHLPTVVEIDTDGIVTSTEQSKAEYRWTGFVGSLETPSQFLLYLSPASMHIFPKRAFIPAENLEAMHHLLESKLARPTSGFPVQNAISPSANVSDDKT